MTAAEQWRPVVGYEGSYEVSERGRVRRVKAKAGAQLGRILTHCLDYHGYPRVCLSLDGRQKNLLVHQLVAAAFIGPCPPGMVVNHRDSVPTNPHPSNLEYVTQRENVLHSFKSGRRRPATPPLRRGEQHPSSKVTEADVLAIRASTESHAALARVYGVTGEAISAIRRGLTWRHLPLFGETR